MGDGGILGIGRVHRLVPVDIVKGVAGDFVFLTRSKDHRCGARDGARSTSPASVMETIRYFGCQPFWSSGYTAPDWTTPD